MQSSLAEALEPRVQRLEVGRDGGETGLQPAVDRAQQVPVAVQAGPGALLGRVQIGQRLAEVQGLLVQRAQRSQTLGQRRHDLRHGVPLLHLAGQSMNAASMG